MKKLYIMTRQSIKAIFANKIRSFLTILGIVIGIGSVIALTGLGEGIKVNISGQISSLGTRTVTVMQNANFAQQTQNLNTPNRGGVTPPGGSNAFGGSTSSLTKEDYRLLLDKDKNSNIELVGGSVSGSAVYNSEYKYSISGVTPSIFKIRDLVIKSGRLIQDSDIENESRFIVVGTSLASQIFGETEPIGQIFEIQNESFEVVGVLDVAKETSFSNPNLNAYIAYSTAMNIFDTQKFNSFTVKAISEESVAQTKLDIQNTLLESHDIKDLKFADFSVSTSEDLLSTVGTITGALSALLSGIAGISLLVGGIGIMNIMLVSVTERTREIGLRKAVGATTWDILIQFLIESVLLTLTGGIIGILLGIGMGNSVGTLIGYPAVVTTDSIVVAVTIASIVGLVFGIYPAFKAALLKPIDALRYE